MGSAQAASFWLLAGILTQTRGPGDSAVLLGWPQLPLGGRGLWSPSMWFRPVLLPGLISVVSLPTPPLLACSVPFAPCGPCYLPSCAKNPVLCLPPCLHSTAVLDLELCVSLLCSADSSCPIPPLCLKDSASGARGEWYRCTSKSSPAFPKASPRRWVLLGKTCQGGRESAPTPFEDSPAG